MTIVDAPGQSSRSEHTVSVSHHLEDYEVDELTELFESKSLKGLPANFAPPHRPVDYFESISVQITLPKGKTKQISTREYYVASLKEKTRYPAALVILMGKIDEIENVASDKGKPSEPPHDCQLNAGNH